jgi:hypothetical protein
MEKTYDEMKDTIKQLYLKACYHSGYADTQDYRGSGYDEWGSTNYAEGFETAYEQVIKALGITVAQEEINAARSSGCQKAIKDHKENYGSDEED